MHTSAGDMGAQKQSGIEELFYRYSLDLMAIVGPDGYFKKVNPAFKQVLGYSEDEIFSRPVVSFLHPNDVERTRKGIETLTTGAQRRASRNRYLLKTGGYRWFSWDTNPIGKEFYTIGRDITEQVEAEEQIRELNRTLEEQNRQLAAASQSKSQFLANMSHELRTPLNAIIGFSEVLRDGLIGEVSAEQKEYLTDIYSSGQHLLSLINDILDLSKVESGKMELTPESVEMLGLLENGLTIVKETAASRGIQLELRHEELPDTIMADGRRLKQIVYNLLTNAVKFSPPGTRVTRGAAGARKSANGRAGRPQHVFSACPRMTTTTMSKSLFTTADAVSPQKTLLNCSRHSRRLIQHSRGKLKARA